MRCGEIGLQRNRVSQALPGAGEVSQFFQCISKVIVAFGIPRTQLDRLLLERV